MLGIKKQQTPHSVIGINMQVNGPCHFRDGLRVDGEVVGDIAADTGTSPSWLIVSETGSVHGAIHADHIVIAGQVFGPVHARERLEMLAHARVQGDVYYKALDMQPGAIITGQLNPQLTPPPSATPPESDPALAVATEPEEAPEDAMPLVEDEALPETESDAFAEPAQHEDAWPSQDKNQVF